MIEEYLAPIIEAKEKAEAERDRFHDAIHAQSGDVERLTAERDAAEAALRAVADRVLDDGAFCFCDSSAREEHFPTCGYCNEARAVLAAADAREKGGANGGL